VKLAVLGATGSIGCELVRQALTAGDEVTALVREQPRPSAIDDRVARVVGDAASAEAVKRAVDGSNAVISALGHAKGTPDDVLAPAAANMIAAMHPDGVARLVVLSSPAVDDAKDRPGLRYRVGLAVMSVAIRGVVHDHREQARLIEKSGLACTIVRGPLLFTDGPHSGRYRAGPITRETGTSISRADLTEFMLATATDGGFIRMKPVVSS
jgi:putative NADH-flavin reductase